MQREVLLDPDKGYGKQLLGRYWSDEIRAQQDNVILIGGAATLNQAIGKMKPGTPVEVPSFVVDWRARHDSNVRPLPSEGSTLSN